MRVDQHKWLPLHAYINTERHYYFKKLYLIRKIIPNLKKDFH